jgi:hypothetical protein
VLILPTGFKYPDDHIGRNISSKQIRAIADKYRITFPVMELQLLFNDARLTTVLFSYCIEDLLRFRRAIRAFMGTLAGKGIPSVCNPREHIAFCFSE